MYALNTILVRSGVWEDVDGGSRSGFIPAEAGNGAVKVNSFKLISQTLPQVIGC
jgi:hypothetical protein